MQHFRNKRLLRLVPVAFAVAVSFTCTASVPADPMRPLTCLDGAALHSTIQEFDEFHSRQEMCINDNDELHGEVRLWNERDNVVSITQYRRGFRHGVEQTFYRSGALRGAFSYVDGVLNGPSRAFREDGSPVQESWYVDGELQGERRFFDSWGDLIKVEMFDAGQRYESFRCPAECAEFLGVLPDLQF